MQAENEMKSKNTMMPFWVVKEKKNNNLLGCRSGNSLTAHVQQGFKVSFPPRFKKDTIMRSIISFKTMKLCALY